MKYSPLLFILFFLSCDKNDDQIVPTITEVECPDVQELGSFDILDSSIGFIPYTSTNSKITFSDSVGNEVVGVITLDTTRMSRNRLPNEYVCEDDSTQFYHYFYDRGLRQVTLEIAEIDLKLHLTLTVFVSRGDQLQIEPKDTLFIFDHLAVRIVTPIIDTSSTNSPSSLNGSFGIIVNSRNHPFSTTSSPSIDVYDINGVNYPNVFFGSSEIEEDEFRVSYNIEHGIIGIENPDRSISLKYEFIE